jgi:rhamnulose-1-phosphate aldolase
MANILEANFMQELIRTCATMYSLGWHEKNGGNLSVLLDESEVSKYLDINSCIRKIDTRFDAVKLAGKIFAFTGTGKYFKNVENDPEVNLGIIRVNNDGKTANLLWGLTDGGGPTSETPTHLRCHIARLQKDPNHKVVMHCHPANILAMTFIHSLDEKAFTRTLWQMMTECILVFPDGVGVLPWMICGNDEIGRATEAKMNEYRLCVWSQHGIFGVGSSLDDAFGLIETAEKAAKIYIKICNSKIINTIADDELKILAKAFNVTPKKDFLN